MEHMAYEAVYVYNGTGGFLGYAIRNTTDGANKLHNTNLWADTPADLADLKEQLTRLNDFTDIRSYWPDVRDPEVLAYTDDPLGAAAAEPGRSHRRCQVGHLLD
jgi:hypothetical protein